MGVGRRIRIGGGLALVLALLAAATAPARAAPCAGLLRPPVPGAMVRLFEPAGKGGHWGVDLAAPVGTVVRAPAPGTVTFAGEVAGVQSVTIAPSDRMRVSLSYLSEVWATAGRPVRSGEPLGRSGLDHGRAAVHLSVRVDGRYVDPRSALGCGARLRSTRWGVRLLPDPVRRRG